MNFAFVCYLCISVLYLNNKCNLYYSALIIFVMHMDNKIHV